MIRILKYFLASVFLLLVITALLLVYVSSSPGEKLLAKIVTGNFNQRFDHRLDIGRLETNVFSRLQISGVSLSSGDPDRGDFAGLRQIDLSYRLLDLFKHRLSINSIVIDGLALSLHADTAGSIILPRLISPSAEKKKQESSLETIVSNAVIQNSRIYFDDKVNSIGGAAENIYLQASYNDSSAVFSSTIETIRMNFLGTDYDLSGFSVKGNLAGEFLKIDSLEAALPGIELTGSGAVSLDDENFPATAELSLSGTVDSLASKFSQYLPAAIQPLTGEVILGLSFAGSKLSQTLKVRAEILRLSLRKIELVNSRLSFTAARDTLIIDNLNLHLAGGQIEGGGYLCLDTVLTHNLSVRYRNFSLESLHQTFISDHSLYTGIIDGSLVSSGGFRNPRSLENAFSFSIRNMSVSGRKIPPLTVNTLIKDGTANAKILQGQSRITTRLALTGKTLDGEFSAAIPNIETFAGLINIEQLTGSFNLKGKISGSQDSPRLYGDFNGKNIRYLNFPLDLIDGGFNYNNGVVALADINFTGQLDDLSELNLPENLRQITGAVTYHGRIEGCLDDLAGELAMSLDKPAFGSYKLDAADARLIVRNNRITLDSLSVLQNHCRIIAAGSLGMESLTGNMNFSLFSENDQDYPGKIESEPFPCQGYISARFDLSKREDIVLEADGEQIVLSMLPQILGTDQKLSGMLDLQLSFHGNPAYPHGSLVFSIIDPGFGHARLDSVKGVLGIGERLVKADSLVFYYKNNRLFTSAASTLDRNPENNLIFTKTSPLKAYLDADTLDISLADEFLQPVQLKGRLNLNADLTGCLGEPHLAGIMEITQGSFKRDLSSLPLENLHLLITMLDTMFIIDDFSGIIKDQVFMISGKASSGDFHEFSSNLTLNSQNRQIFSGKGTISADNILYNIKTKDLDLSIFQGVFPGLATVQGKVNASVIVQGPLQQPEFRGKLRIDNFAYKPVSLDAPLTNGIVKTVFNGRQANLDSAFIRYKKGYVFAVGAGQWNHEGFTAFSVHAQASQLNFTKAKEYKINLVSSDLIYKLTDYKYRLDGDLVLGETRVLHRFQPEVLLKFLQKSEKPAMEMPDILRRTVFNVRVRESENIWIDNNLAKLRLHSELALTGTPSRPNLNGRLSVREGYVYYLDRRFAVVTGILDFADPVRPSPVIDLVAETSVRNYRASGNETYLITLNIAGPLDAAQIELFSEPPLDRSDILSLLTLGITQERSVADGSDGKNITFGGAVKERLEETSTRRISGYFAKKAESSLGLSQFSVEGNLFNASNKSGPQLLASRRLSKRMEVTYITTVGHMNDQGIRLDYLLNNYFSLEGQTDQTGKSGIDLKYRIKY